MVAVLASPRFLFREEGIEVVAGVSPAVEPGVPPGGKDGTTSNGRAKSRTAPGGRMPPAGGTPATTTAHPLVDEYALASRLSYFFWSSMPDAELFRQADAGILRKNLSAQVKRMLTDPRSDALMKNFTGQWLQARDIETVTIDARQVLAREAAADPDMDRRRQRFRELRDKPEEELTAEEKD